MISRITASTIGSIIIAVAVSEIHMLRAAVAIMKPSTSFRPPVPTRLTMKSAIRRWRFQRCIAMAMKNPPMKRMMLRFM